MVRVGSEPGPLLDRTQPTEREMRWSIGRGPDRRLSGHRIAQGLFLHIRYLRAPWLESRSGADLHPATTAPLRPSPGVSPGSQFVQAQSSPPGDAVAEPMICPCPSPPKNDFRPFDLIIVKVPGEPAS